MRFSFAVPTFFLLTSFLAISPVHADAPHSAKHDLTPASFKNIHATILPRANEWRHLKIDWITDVTAARKKAVAEDKPIVILYTGGAGYNEPLGVC